MLGPRRMSVCYIHLYRYYYDYGTRANRNRIVNYNTENKTHSSTDAYTPRYVHLVVSAAVAARLGGSARATLSDGEKKITLIIIIIIKQSR